MVLEALWLFCSFGSGSFLVGIKMTQIHKENWEKAFDDWEQLLTRADAEELKNDPKSVWDEAWRQATFILWSIVEANLKAPDRIKMHEIMKAKMLS